MFFAFFVTLLSASSIRVFPCLVWFASAYYLLCVPLVYLYFSFIDSIKLSIILIKKKCSTIGFSFILWYTQHSRIFVTLSNFHKIPHRIKYIQGPFGNPFPYHAFFKTHVLKMKLWASFPMLTLEREAQRNRENNLCIEYSK